MNGAGIVRECLALRSDIRILVATHGDTVGKLTAADCRRFHQQHLVPNNMVLAIFGDIDPQATLAQLEKSFGALARRDDVLHDA